MNQISMFNTHFEQAYQDLLPRLKQGLFRVEIREAKEGDFVRYPVGWSVETRRVQKDESNDLYVEGEINNVVYRQYLYKQKENVKWDTRLSMELGFFIVDEPIDYK